MLIARVVTALVGAPIVVLLVWTGGLPLLVMAAAVAGLASWEAFRLLVRARAVEGSDRGEQSSTAPAGPHGPASFSDLLWSTCAIAGSLVLVLAAAGGPLAETAALAIVLLICLIASLGLPSTRPASATWSDAFAASVYGGLPLALLVLTRQWPGRTSFEVAILGQLNRGAAWVLVALTTVWAIDSAAYIVGRLVGRRRLWPRISPGKTWEGTAAGLIAGIIVCELWAPVIEIGDGFAFILGLVLAVCAVLGDLVESAMKRAARVKDSGTLLPGHGGLLDRVDSLAFAFVVVFLSGVLVTPAGPRQIF